MDMPRSDARDGTVGLLDDVRAFTRSRDVDGECPICGAYCPDDGVPDDHDPQCQMLTLMPKIVTALEATQALVDAHVHLGLWRVTDDPKELGDRQQAALLQLWEFGIRPAAIDEAKV